MNLITQNQRNIDFILVSVLIVYIVNFFDIGSILFIIFVPFIFMSIWGMKLNKSQLLRVFFLFSFSFSYALIAFYYGFMGVNTATITLIFPVTVYLMGAYIGSNDRDYHKTYKTLVILSLSLSVFMILSYIRTLSTYGSLDTAIYVFGERTLLNFWGTDDYKATVVTAFLAITLASFPVIFIKEKTPFKIKHITKMTMLFTFIASLFITIQMGSRTSIVIIVISIVILFLFNNLKSIKKILSLFIYILLLGISYILYLKDIFGVRTFFMQTAVYKRFETTGLESSRYEAWKDVFYGILEHPMGKRETIFNLAYAHNLWLDVGYDVGIIPFVLVLIFTILAIISFFKFLILRHNLYMKSLIISFMIGFFIIFMTEPVLATKERFLFILFCLTIGMIDGLNQGSRQKDMKKCL